MNSFVILEQNHSEPAGFDGPGECLRWVYGENFGYDKLKYAVDYKLENVYSFNQSEFVDDWGVGLTETGLLYVPDRCKADANSSVACKLLFMLGGDNDFARYAESNDIVMVGLGIGGYVDRSRFPNACEVIRGLSDVYGQLSEDYAMQSGYQMRVAGRIVRRHARCISVRLITLRVQLHPTPLLPHPLDVVWQRNHRL